MTTTPISGSGFDASAYLNKIKGTAPATPTPPTTTPTTSAPPTTTPSSVETLGIPSNVLTLLQGSGAGSATSNQLSTLLGDGGNGISPTNQLSGVYNGLLASSTTNGPIEEAIAAANQQAAQTTTQNSFVQDLINGLNTAANAYNQTLLTQAQSVVNSNKGLIA